MRNVKLTIEYDGTNYCGWQKQNNEKTIQEEIEKAIYKAVGEVVEVIGSSRTDAGVHARKMVANFKTNATIPFDKFKYAINDKLPDDIAIIESEEVSEDFHARYDSKGKTYCYSIINRQQKPAIGRNYVYHFKWDLDIEKMREACKHFIGKHDFKAFRSLGSSVKTTERTIEELYIESEGEKINIFITADGFLYNMVRIIVGTLLKVGRGKIPVEDIEKIILLGDRKKAGPCVPAQGLILEKVYY